MDALYWRGEIQATPLGGKIQAGDCCGRSREIEREEVLFSIGTNSVVQFLNFPFTPSSRAECDKLTASMLTALRYYWITARGYRLRPWASPYIRWRLETFFGGDMHALGPAEFFGLIWRERKQLRAFLAWTAERWRVQRGDRS